MPSFRPCTHGRIIEFSRLQMDRERETERARMREGEAESHRGSQGKREKR